VTRLKGMRLHVRAIVRDGTRAFVGSQSLRKLELESRREVGMLISNPSVAGKILQVFEADWAASRGVDAAAVDKAAKKDDKTDKSDIDKKDATKAEERTVSVV